jgi:hypothetical protein
MRKKQQQQAITRKLVTIAATMTTLIYFGLIINSSNNNTASLSSAFAATASKATLGSPTLKTSSISNGTTAITTPGSQKVVKITSPADGSNFNFDSGANGASFFVHLTGYATFCQNTGFTDSPMSICNPRPIPSSNLSWYAKDEDSGHLHYLGTGTTVNGFLPPNSQCADVDGPIPNAQYAIKLFAKFPDGTTGHDTVHITAGPQC